MVLDADFLSPSLRSHHLPRLGRLLSLLISAGNGVTSLSLFVGWVDEEFFPLRDPYLFLITLESNTIWMADNERSSTKYQRSRKWIAPVFTSESDFRPIVLWFPSAFLREDVGEWTIRRGELRCGHRNRRLKRAIGVVHHSRFAAAFHGVNNKIYTHHPSALTKYWRELICSSNLTFSLAPRWTFVET